jgi:hypothetical protein
MRRDPASVVVCASLEETRDGTAVEATRADRPSQVSLEKGWGSGKRRFALNCHFEVGEYDV